MAVLHYREGSYTMSTARAPAQPASARHGLLARHPLVSFFVMAYAFTWIVRSPWVLGQDGAGLLPIKISQAASGYLNAAAILAGPTLAAFIMTATTEGRAGAAFWVGWCYGGLASGGTCSPSLVSP